MTELFSYTDKTLQYFGTSLGKFLPPHRQYVGPIYLYHGPLLLKRAKEYKKALPQVKSFYAMKANHHPQVVTTLMNEGFGIDAVSAGEIRFALKLGFSPSEIIFSGVGKTRADLLFAIQSGIYQINVESLPELSRISQICKENGFKQNLGLRINPDISIESHPYISTGLKENKFGIELNSLPTALEIIQNSEGFISLTGLSVHLGSQMLELSGFSDGLGKVVELFSNLQMKMPTLQRLDVGGGVGIDYENSNLEKEELFLKSYADIIFEKTKHLKNCQLMSEPGRWLVAHAGVLISEVQYIKRNSEKSFVILDSGMNHLMRPCLYEAFHQVLPVVIDDQAKKESFDIVGPICESSDFFAKNRNLQTPSEGDYLVIADTGAYGAVLSSDYNLQEKAEEIFITHKS